VAQPTLILGVGNVLLKDEGVGVHVARRLQSMPLPSTVEVIDGGTGGYELITFCSGRERIVFVDCAMADGPPGTVFCSTPEELKLKWAPAFSAHQSGLLELLHHVSALQPHPQILIVGVVPENNRSPGMELSPTLSALLDRIALESLRIATGNFLPSQR
jgi:hydrogenase maturation protease